MARYILKRWIECGRKPTLVICQGKKSTEADPGAGTVENWLNKSGLPSSIQVEHFNAISGLDQYKGVREVIEEFYPQIEVVADVEAEMPHTYVRQILTAPVARRKLFNGDSEQYRNLKALRP